MTLRANQLAALAAAIDARAPLDTPGRHAAARSSSARIREMGQHDRAFVADGVFA